MAVRNAQVLRPQNDVPLDTVFNEKLELFRAERAEKNKNSVNSVQLKLPGKVIHLCDTNDNGNCKLPLSICHVSFLLLITSLFLCSS